MATFTVWRFSTDTGAQRAVHPLARWRSTTVGIEDAAVVSWPADRTRPVAWQAHDLAGGRPLAGAFWALLVGLLFLLPLAGSGEDSQPEPAADEGKIMGALLSQLGFDDHFASTVQAQVTAGTSALLLLSTGEESGDLGSARPPGADLVVAVSLRVDQFSGLHAAFDG